MRYVVVTFALCLLVVSAHAGTYVETFDDGDLAGWEFVEGLSAVGQSEWKVVDGVATCRNGAVAGSILFFGEDDWRNYTIECDARVVEPIANLYNTSLGLRMLWTNSTDFNYIWCLPSPPWGAALIWSWFNGNGSGQSARKPFEHEINRWYRLKGVAHEDSFELYIDGELMASMSDSRFPTGRPGLQANGCLANFDNVVISGDDVPDSTAAVSTSGKMATRWGRLRSQ